MEEVFEKVDGVLEVISGYSGGDTKNPTYKEVTYGKTGHFETIKIKYDSTKIKYQNLLDAFWVNIDPFDADGQFCDKGYSYRSVAFYTSDTEKDLIEKETEKGKFFFYQNATSRDFNREFITKNSSKGNWIY